MLELEIPFDPRTDLFTGLMMRTGRYSTGSKLKCGNAAAAEYGEALTGPSNEGMLSKPEPHTDEASRPSRPQRI
jgi:hypothetical protein